VSDLAGGELTGAALLGATRWLSVHDDLLRGLTHTLSNRVGTIAAAAYMIELQPGAVATTAATLREESDKLEALLQLFRLLPRRDDAVAEPVIPTDSVNQAFALQAHHPELHDVPVTMAIEGDLQPAYAEPTALAIATVLVLGAAQRAAKGAGLPGARAELVISSTTDEVRLRARAFVDDTLIRVAVDSQAELDVLAVTWMLTPYGGRGATSDAGATVLIPTLQAARRARRS
jgi:hypothetical protein